MRMRPPTKENILLDFQDELDYIEECYQDSLYDIERDRGRRILHAERARDEALAALANEPNEEEAQ